MMLVMLLYSCYLYKLLLAGEFGVVYRARLGPMGLSGREVAVKTLKGLSTRKMATLCYFMQCIVHIFTTRYLHSRKMSMIYT